MSLIKYEVEAFTAILLQCWLPQTSVCHSPAPHCLVRSTTDMSAALQKVTVILIQQWLPPEMIFSFIEKNQINILFSLLRNVVET